MHPLKSLEPEERERYDYLKKIFEAEFEETCFAFRVSGILVDELVSLLSLCSFFFDEYGFPGPEHSRLLYQSITNAAAQYLAVFHGMWH